MTHVVPPHLPASWPPKENGRLKIAFGTVVTLGVTVIGWVVSLMLAWNMVNSRVAVMESKQHETDRRLERIELKVDELLKRP